MTGKQRGRDKYVCAEFQLFMYFREQTVFNLMASHLRSVTLGDGLAGLEKEVSFSRKPLCDTLQRKDSCTVPWRKEKVEKSILL